MKSTFDPHSLIDLRTSNYWTQEDLAAASGVSVRTIQRIESGETASLESWRALAAAFDVGLDQLERARCFVHYSALEIKMGLTGLVFASVVSGVGCLVPWVAVALGLRQGGDFAALWPFLTLAIGLTLMCGAILIWGWQRFLRLMHIP